MSFSEFAQGTAHHLPSSPILQDRQPPPNSASRTQIMLAVIALWLRCDGVSAGTVGFALVLGLAVLVLSLLNARQAKRLAQEQSARATAEAAHQKIQQIFESITDAFVTVNEQWQYTYLNREAERLLRRQRQDVLGKTMREVFPEGAGSEFDQEYRRAVTERITVEVEAFYAPLGRWFAARAYPFEGGLAIYFRDVTKRRQLEEERQKFVSLVENSKDFIGMAGLDQRPFYLNQAGRDLVGLDSMEEVRATDIFVYQTPESQAHFREIAMPTLMSSGYWQGEGQLRHFKTQKPIDVQITMFLVKNLQTDQPLCLATITRDITERKRIEADLRDTQALFQSFMQHSPTIAFIKDEAGRYLYVNSLSEQLFPNSLGKTDFETLPAEVAQQIRENDLRAMETGQAIKVVETMPHLAESSSYHFLSLKFPFQDSKGQRKLLGMSLDITERIRAEAALRLNEQRLRIAIQNLPIVIFNQDQALRYTWVHNPQLGISVQDTLGKTDLDLLPPEQAQSLIELKQRVLASGLGAREEVRLQRGDQIACYDLTIEPLRDSAGQIIGILGAALDITERKRAEANRLAQARAEQLERQMAELQRLNLLKDDFLSTVSHELRTPMTNMKMSIHLLRLAIQPEQRERYLQILEEECAREIRLINNLLDLQRLEAEAAPVELESLQLQAWLPPIVEPFRERARARQQTLQLKIATDLLPLLSHPPSLERIVVELLNNACKYAPPGSMIVVSAHLAGQPALVISNAGAEIPAAELERIFEKFYRMPSSDPWQQGGTGLGLALVKRLVEHLGGSIRAESSDGWTTFTLLL